MIKLDPTMILISLGVAFAASMAYFGLLALITRGMRTWGQKRALTVLLASLPFRLALLAIPLIWLLRYSGLVGAMAILLCVWLGRVLTNRWVRALERRA